MRTAVKEADSKKIASFELLLCPACEEPLEPPEMKGEDWLPCPSCHQRFFWSLEEEEADL